MQCVVVPAGRYSARNVAGQAPPNASASPVAAMNSPTRHYCYELHIGFTHLGWNIWTREPG